MNRKTRHISCCKQFPTVNTDSNKNHIHITHITYYKAKRELKTEKSYKIDLFNCTLKRCEGTEVNTVTKRIPAINHMFTEKFACMQCVFWH